MLSSAPTIVWLIDSDDPTGITTMALRRATALSARAECHVFALHLSSDAWPATLPIGQVRVAPSELAADLVVTTSPRTLKWAVARRSDPAVPTVHFMGTRAELALADETFMTYADSIDVLAVPIGTDLDRMAAALGRPQIRISHYDDFTLAGQTLLSSATSNVVISAGRLDRDSGMAELIDAFALARDSLPGWQARIYGRGPMRTALEERIRLHDLSDSVYLMGYAADISLAFGEASVAIRIAAGDAIGLSVYEALSAGVPVIGAQGVPAVRRKVVDDQNGIVLERTDPVEIASALRRISQPAVHRRLAEGARNGDCGLVDDDTITDLWNSVTAPLAMVG